MKISILYITLFLCLTHLGFSQDDGVVALDLPVRNSLRFNRYALNPTFSFVREQYKYVSFTNKRDRVQFENAPQTYLFSFSGRLNENMGAGLGLFQQNFGVFTTFGGIGNFAYNAVLNRYSNLTFGLNFGFYTSGINDAEVIADLGDPSLMNIPSNSLIFVNPGINYGTEFLDFGVSVNNLAVYNLTTSKIIEENPEQSILAHTMYHGYFGRRGFFDESKFSALITAEIKEEETIFSGLMMVLVPRGIWAQLGYNTLYGASGGLGINVTSQIAIEYNYERAIGSLDIFGSSHEVTVAYRFKNKNRYDYSGDDYEEGLFINDKRKSPVKKRKTTPTKKVEKVATIAQNEEETQKTEEEVIEKVEEKNVTEIVDKTELPKQETPKVEEETPKKEVKEETPVNIETVEKVETPKVEAPEEKVEPSVITETIKEEKEEDLSESTDKEAVAMKTLVEVIDKSKTEQEFLLIKIRERVAIKQQDLEDIKRENDLSEQGIYNEPKAFKSVSEENASLEALKNQAEALIKSQSRKISKLQDLYDKRRKTVKNAKDPTNVYYARKIQQLKREQLQLIQSKNKLITTIEEIKEAIELERKRRIKPAAYDNEETRYLNDRLSLSQIKETTTAGSQTFKEKDFDFGEKLSNVEIVKDVINTESGYYLVLAVHSDISKRDEFLKQVIVSGQADIDFFFDVNTNKYYIYYQKFFNIDDAKRAIESKDNKPYNRNLSIVKIEN